MDLHQAKCSAFQSCCDDFRRAINANLEDLSYGLYTAGLIPAEVRNRRAADEIVSAVENRLANNEFAWNPLIEVLRGSDGGATLACRLTDHLRVKLSGENARENARDANHGNNILREQRPNPGESPACCAP